MNNTEGYHLKTRKVTALLMINAYAPLINGKMCDMIINKLKMHPTRVPTLKNGLNTSSEIGNVSSTAFQHVPKGNKWLILTRAGCCLNCPKIRNLI